MLNANYTPPRQPRPTNGIFNLNNVAKYGLSHGRDMTYRTRSLNLKEV